MRVKYAIFWSSVDTCTSYLKRRPIAKVTRANLHGIFRIGIIDILSFPTTKWKKSERANHTP
jgi:hypothetical protein